MYLNNNKKKEIEKKIKIKSVHDFTNECTNKECTLFETF